MKKSFLLLLTFALIGALHPASAQTALPSSLQKNVQIGGTDPKLPDIIAYYATAATVSGPVSTNGHTITVKDAAGAGTFSGELIIASTGTLTIQTSSSGTTANRVTIEGGGIATVQPGGKVIAGNAPSTTNLGSHGVIIEAGAEVTNEGVIDFSQGGTITVNTNGSSAATLNSPGIIILKQENSLAGEGVGTVAATANGFFKTLYVSGTTKKNVIDVYGTAEWTDLIQSYFKAGDKLVVLPNGESDSRPAAHLTIPLGTTLTVNPTSATEETKLTDGLYVGGTLIVEGTLENHALVNVNPTGTITLEDQSHATNYQLVRIQSGGDGGSLNVNGGATVDNHGVIDVLGKISNLSTRVTSPGIILLQNGATLVGYTDGTWKDPASGFVKATDGGSTWIDIYGKSNEWSALHNVLLNGGNYLNDKGNYTVNGVEYNILTGAAELRVREGSKLTIPAGVELSVDGGKLDVRDSLIVNGSVAVSQGESTIESTGTAIINTGAEIVIDGGTVTANKDAIIQNAGKIKISGDNNNSYGTLINNSTKVNSTGIIEVSGTGSLKSTANPLVLPQQAVVVYTLNNNGYGSTKIDVIGGNKWSAALQAYLTRSYTLVLNRSIDTLDVRTHALEVPVGTTLTITGTGAPNASPGVIIGNSANSFVSKGLTKLENFSIYNLHKTSGTGEAYYAVKTGFFEIGNTIYVYGTGNEWLAYHQAEIDKTVNTLWIPESAALNFTALSIGAGKTLENRGTLTGGSLLLEGKLRKAATSATNLTPANINIKNAGKIEVELRPEWVTFATTLYTDITQYNSLFIVTDPDSTHALTAGVSYRVENPYGPDEHLRAILGGLEEGTDKNSNSHYYGTIEQPYTPVEGVTISPAEDLTLKKGQEPVTLAAIVTPAKSTGADEYTDVNPNVIWTAIPTEGQDYNAVSVSDGGEVTPLRAGVDTIIVTTVEGGFKDTCVVTVYIPVESVTIAEEADTLQVGETHQLTAEVFPSEAHSSVTWTSDNEEVATVSDDGLVTAVAVGNAKIYVASEENPALKDSVLVKVIPVAVTGVKLKAVTNSLAVGKTFTFTADVQPDNAANKEVTWSSSEPTVATVSEDGRVTAVAAGSTYIIVTSVDGGYKDSLKVTVHTVPVESVTLNGGDRTLEIEETVTLSATVWPDSATNKDVRWKSDNESIAKVDPITGELTAVWAGTAKITVTTVDGDYTAAAEITVTTLTITHVTDVTLDKKEATLLTGSTLQLTATLQPAKPYRTDVTWNSSNPAVATVSQDGLVTAVAPGTANITVTTGDGGYTATAVITVPVPEVPVTGVTITAGGSVAVGSSLQLTATVTPDDATNKDVTWTSSDEEVATVSQDGLVTAVAAGEATITVTTVDGEHKDSVTITVYTEEVPVKGVTIEGATGSLAVEATLQLTAVIEPEDANVDYTVAWSSSDDKVATVKDGLVTGVAAGEATITLTVTTEDGEEYKDSVAITVYVVPKITKVAIESEGTTLTIVTRPEGEEYDYGTLQLEAVVTTEGEGEVDYTVAWASSKDKVATVDEEGLVTAVAEGTVTITLTVTETATGEKHTATLDITITTVGVAAVPTAVKAYIADNTLYVNGAVTEKVDIYTISGKLVYSAVKPAGEVQIPLTGVSDGVLIIRGASGWVQKVVK